MSAPKPPHATPAAAPAYAAAPRRTGLLYAIAGIVALAALAAMAIFLFGGRAALPVGAPAEPVATDAQKSLAATKAALDQASRNVLNPSGPAPDAQPASEPPTPMPATPPVPAAEPPRVAATEPPRVAATAEPPRPAQRPPAAPPAPKASSAPARTPVPEPAAPPAAAPPVQVASADRWAQMRNELAACPKSSAIPRCEQRIRERYCEGSWGSVPECPGARR